MTRRSEAREPVGLHDILVAWQDGWLPYRRALALTGMSTVTDLYEAAANSGVEIRMAISEGTPADIVVASVAPLVSLAATKRLDQIENLDRPVKVLDIVKEECLRNADAQGKAELKAWFSTRDGAVEIVPSPIMPAYEAARASEIDGTDLHASEGLGDAAISWLIAKVPRLYGPKATSFVLTEQWTEAVQARRDRDPASPR